MPGERPAVVDGLDVNEATDGLIVYEPDRDLVHYLNASASFVFALCDGTQTAADIAALMASAWDLEALPSREVDACIAHLRSERLVR